MIYEYRIRIAAARFSPVGLEADFYVHMACGGSRSTSFTSLVDLVAHLLDIYPSFDFVIDSVTFFENEDAYIEHLTGAMCHE